MMEALTLAGLTIASVVLVPACQTDVATAAVAVGVPDRSPYAPLEATVARPKVVRAAPALASSNRVPAKAVAPDSRFNSAVVATQPSNLLSSVDVLDNPERALSSVCVEVTAPVTLGKVLLIVLFSRRMWSSAALVRPLTLG
jgi:hypothetical protein